MIHASPLTAWWNDPAQSAESIHTIPPAVGRTDLQFIARSILSLTAMPPWRPLFWWHFLHEASYGNRHSWLGTFANKGGGQ